MNHHFTKSRPTIAFLTHSDIRDPSNFTLWTGIYDAAKAEGVNLICLPGNPLNSPIGYDAQANKLYNLVSENNIDGLLVWGAGILALAKQQDIDQFFEGYKKFFRISIGILIEGVPSIVIDNYNSMYEACIHLIEKHKCRQIAFIRGPENHQEAELRFSAYKDALKKYNLPLEPALIAQGNFLRESGTSGIKKILDDLKAEFDAVVAANDLMALGILKELHNLGIKIPDDVKIIGFDDTEEGRYGEIPLTTVKQPFYDMGKLAVKNLLSIMNNEKLPEKTIFPTRFIRRQSCGCMNSLVAEAEVDIKIIAPGRPFGKISLQKDNLFPEIIKIIEESSTSRGLPAEAAEDILSAFLDEIKNLKTGEFLSTLNQYLINIRDNNEFNLFHQILSALRRLILPIIQNDKGLTNKAENLWHQGRVLISEYAHRLSALWGLLKEEQNEFLQGINQKLAATFEIEELMNIAAQELPRFGIPSCFLSLYDRSLNNYDKCRLMLAYTDKGRKETDSEKLYSSSVNLVPEGFLPEKRQYAVIVEALYFREEHLGFVVFEEGPRDAYIYDALRSQLSVAIKGALLFKEREVLLRNLENRSRELLKTAEVLKRSNTELEQFSYISSHDLQEPLRKIITFGDRLKNKFYDVLGDQGRDYLERMQAASQRMHNLINALLSYSRLSIRAQPFDWVDLNQIIREVLSDMEVRIKKQKAKIELKELPEIEAEPLQMQQLFQNFISNALKFHKPDKPPVIRVYGKILKDKGNGLCEITVEDNGIGIEDIYFDHIFGVFQRLHGQSEYEGTGIGLAICRKITDRHNGNIRVATKLDEGTKFIITLPVNQYKVKEENKNE